MFKRLSKLKENLYLIMWGFKTINDIQPGYMWLKFGRDTFDAFVPFINIMMSAHIINELIFDRSLQRLVMYVLLTIVLNLLIQTGSRVFDGFIGVKYQQFRHLYSMRLNSVILDMAYDKVEDPETHQHRQQIMDNHNTGGGGLQRYMGGSTSIFFGLATAVFSIAFTLPAFITFSDSSSEGILAMVDTPLASFIMVAIIVICAGFSSIISAKNTQDFIKAVDENVSTNRLYFHYINHLEDYKTGKDVRLYNQKGMLSDIFTTYFDKTKALSKKTSQLDLRSDGLQSVLLIIVLIASYIFVGMKALAGAFPVGNIVLYVGAIGRFREGLMSFMRGVGQLYSNTEQLKTLKTFLEIPAKKHGGEIPVLGCSLEIEFRNVSFKYPGSENYALKNLSIKLNVGEKLAVVGQNGSGKTTFIKLLCRLYDPTEGEILLNGVNIKEYNFQEYMTLFSVVFQDFSLFSFSLGENIAASIDYDEALAKQHLKESGLDERYAKMENGLRTYLYKDFDESGVDISGGEAQKVALARALYKNAPFIILDEPTAALDPIAEFEIYSKFNEIVKQRTAVYISHRLSSCRFCDDIAVFHNGMLVQRGRHDVLVSEVGKYQELWEVQAQYY